MNYEADLGFVGAHKPIDKIVAKPLCKDKMVLIAASPWKEELEKKQKEQQNGVLNLKDIVDLPFVFRTEGSATRKVFENTLEGWGKKFMN